MRPRQSHNREKKAWNAARGGFAAHHRRREYLRWKSSRSAPRGCDGKAKGKNRAVAQLAGHADGTAMRGKYGFGDRESHAGAANQIALVPPAIKFVENKPLLEGIDSRPAIRDTDHYEIAAAFRGHAYRLIFRRIELRVIQQLHQHIFGALQIRANRRQQWLDLQLHIAISKRFFYMLDCRLNDG